MPVFGGPGKDKNAGCIGRELGDGTAAGDPQEAREEKPDNCSHLPTVANSGLEIKPDELPRGAILGSCDVEWTFCRLPVKKNHDVEHSWPSAHPSL